MKRNLKMPFLITIFSVIPCFLYNYMLHTEYNSYLLTSIAKLFLFIGFPALCFLFTNTKITDIISTSGNKKLLKVSAVLGIGCALLIIICFILLNSFFDRNQIINGLRNEDITKTSYPAVFVYIVFINAFLEEFFFRGFVFFTIYKAGYKAYAHIYSSILFSFYHTSIIITWFSPVIFSICIIGLAAAGVIFNELDRRCDNIYGGLLIHVGANLGINLIGAYLFLI